MPPRQVFLLDEKNHDKHDAFAMLPSWNDKVIALKSFTYFPDNQAPYKSLYSKILLFDRSHGEPLAMVDGTTCTFYRTAAMSALAADFLARREVKKLLIIGTGNLAQYLIKAHTAVRSYENILVWGREPKKAQKIANDFKNFSVPVTVIENLQEACKKADVIICATGSHDILVYGDWIKAGTHCDFLGNHHKNKRECDTDLILKSKVYVDTYANCLKEAGEILMPIEEGVFSKENIIAEMAELCRKEKPSRVQDNEITLFKSVGSALSDLVAAQIVFEYYK